MLQNFGDVCFFWMFRTVFVAETEYSLNHYVTVHGDLVLTSIIAWLTSHFSDTVTVQTQSNDMLQFIFEAYTLRRVSSCNEDRRIEFWLWTDGKRLGGVSQLLRMHPRSAGHPRLRHYILYRKNNQILYIYIYIYIYIYNALWHFECDCDIVFFLT